MLNVFFVQQQILIETYLILFSIVISMKSKSKLQHRPSLNSEIEPLLKQILQLSIEEIKPKLKTKSVMAELQQLLLDYTNTEQLAHIIINVIKFGIAHPYATANSFNNQIQKDIWEQQIYLSLQASLQKHEEKIRNCIRNQQQMKLYCEQLQAKIKQVEEAKHQVVISTKKTILELKRDNQQLIEKLKKITDIQDKNPSLKKSSLPFPISSNDGSSYLTNSARDKIAQSKDDSVDNKEIMNRLTPVGQKTRHQQNISKSKSIKKDVISHHKGSYEKVEALKGKIDQVNNIMESIQASRSLRGSVSSMRMRQKRQVIK